jgi:hypothetical protein
MRNLLAETIEILALNNLTGKDVEWVGNSFGSYSIDWATFESIANVEYYESYGGQEIAEELVVVGKDWWLERHEYDGSEWWEFKRLPIRQLNSESFDSVLRADMKDRGF